MRCALYCMTSAPCVVISTINTELNLNPPPELTKALYLTNFSVTVFSLPVCYISNIPFPITLLSCDNSK